VSYGHFIITGSGRSGTRYASELISRAGIACAHQQVFHERCDLPGFSAQWHGRVGDSSCFAFGVSAQALKNCLIIHQTRDPRLVIPSLLKNRHVVGVGKWPGVAHLERNLPGLKDIVNEVERAAVQWYGVNSLVERFAGQPNYVHWRLEDYSLDRLFWLWDQLGVPFGDTKKIGEAMEEQSKLTGTTGVNEPVNLRSIQHKGFHEMVIRYGYGG